MSDWETMAPAWLGRMAVQQDLVWFAALLVWGLAAVLWRRAPARRAAWGWVPWTAGAGIASAFAQFWIFNPPFGFFYERLVPGTSSTFEPALIDPNLFGDFGLATVLAAAAAGWWWQRLSAGAAGWRRVAVVAMGGVALLQQSHPAAAAWLLALAPWPVTAFWWARLPRRRSRAALVLAASLPAVSTVGPLAIVCDALQRNGPPTAIGLVAGAVSLLAAGLTLVELAAAARAGVAAEARAELAREARPFYLGAAAWLVAGLAYAILSGRDNCDEVRLNRLRLVVSEAHALDPNAIARLVGPGVQLERPPGGREQRWGFSRALAKIDRRPVEDAMRRLVHATPFLQVARIVTLRDGWVLAVASNELPVRRDFVELLRPANAQDEADWAAKRNLIEQSPVPEIRQPYYCRAALTDADGRMLGWLEFVREEFYSTTPRKWRAEPLMVTALGVVLAAIAFAQRRDAKERNAALRVALMADEANRLKTSFLAKVSHELRTPLQSMLGYGELLQRELPEGAGRAQLGALRQSGELMLRLVNDLLDLSAIEAGAFRFLEKPVAPAALVGQAVESFRPRAEAKGLSLSFAADERVPAWVTSDPERLRQIVVNLVGNAVKFTDRGGVTVTLGVTAEAGGECTLEILVSDTGPGIAPEDRARLFQPFSRLELSAPKEGAGLGLALVAALCRTAGGDVTVESDGRSGAGFRARVGCRIAAAPAAEKGGEPLRSLRGKRVLVADDNRLVRELFAAWLQELGAECGAVEDGEQALERARAGGWDALVLDLAMPRLGGLEVTARLRANEAGRRLRIVGVSAHARAEDRAEALAAGMDAFLTKPVERADFAAALAVEEAASAAASAREPTALQVRMAEAFRAELPAQLKRMAEAQARREWSEVADRAHWFKNSAAVLHDTVLFAHSAALEEAAENENAAVALAAWENCRVALRSWRSEENRTEAA